MNNPFSKLFTSVDGSQLPPDIQYQRPRITIAIVLLFLVTIIMSFVLFSFFVALILTAVSCGLLYYFLYKYNKMLEELYM